MLFGVLTELAHVVCLHDAKVGLHPTGSKCLTMPQERQWLKQIELAVSLLHPFATNATVVDDESHAGLRRGIACRRKS